MSPEDQERELSRDEVWVPTGVGPTEWVRSNAYVNYRMLKGAGPLAFVYVGSMALVAAMAATGHQRLALYAAVVVQVIYLVMLGVAFFNVFRARRLGIEDQRRQEQAHHPRHHPRRGGD